MRLEGKQLDLLFETLFEITRLVHTERGDRVLFARALETCGELLQADRIMLFHVTGDVLNRYSKRGTDEALQSDVVHGKDVLLHWLEEEGRPFLGPCGELHFPLPETPFEHPKASIVCAPLIAKESQVGMMLAVRDVQQRDFEASDLKLLTMMANQVAIAIENAELYARLRHQAVTDELTGIHNYRSLMSSLENEMARATRHAQIFAFVMADVDHLKGYNERFGHIAGSRVLAEVAQLIKDNCRSIDIVGKYGGDEFAFILPQTNEVGARAVSERVRRAIARHHFKHVSPGDITCSFGISFYPADAHDVKELIRQADQILFEAKRIGKNTVLTASDIELLSKPVAPTPPRKRGSKTSVH